MSRQLEPFWEDVPRAAAAAGWSEQALAPEFRRLERAGEEPVTMDSRAWSGSPGWRLVRATWMHSSPRLEVFNLVAYPATAYATPIFATDVVLLRGQLRIAVVDAMPVRPPAEDPAYAARWVEPFMDLQRTSVERFPRFLLRREWSQRYLGPAACLATDAGPERLDELRALWSAYWTRYLEHARREPPAERAVAAAVATFHRDYNREHAEVELQRNPLVRLFGPAAGSRFIRDFLFAS